MNTPNLLAVNISALAAYDFDQDEDAGRASPLDYNTQTDSIARAISENKPDHDALDLARGFADYWCRDLADALANGMYASAALSAHRCLLFARAAAELEELVAAETGQPTIAAALS